MTCGYFRHAAFCTGSLQFLELYEHSGSSTKPWQTKAKVHRRHLPYLRRRSILMKVHLPFGNVALFPGRGKTKPPKRKTRVEVQVLRAFIAVESHAPSLYEVSSCARDL